MRSALINGSLLYGDELVSGMSLILEDQQVLTCVPAGEEDAECRVDLRGGTLLPGFIDTQVNGGGGRLFNDDPTVETIAHLGRVHRQFGTTGFLPTLISSDLELIAEALDAVDAAIEQGIPGVLGIHVEGPFLNKARRGIHDAAKFQPLGARAIRLLCAPRRGCVLVTLAPEMVAPAAIQTLAAAGVIVSAGHTNATAEITRNALRHGLTGFTHLFNAMSPLTSREPGVVGTALDDDASWCGIIADGHHVHPTVVKLAARLKLPGRLMLATDAMPSVGVSEKAFMLGGNRIEVKGGVCVNEAGVIAGSDLDMASALRNAMRFADLSLSAAAPMASSNPAAFLGLSEQMGRIAPGLRANLVLLDDRLQVHATWIDGQRVDSGTLDDIALGSVSPPQGESRSD